MMLPTLPQPTCNGCTLDGRINDVAGDEQNSGVSGAALTACALRLSPSILDRHCAVRLAEYQGWRLSRNTAINTAGSRIGPLSCHATWHSQMQSESV